ncbi:hypothetical protein DFJ73DRAFT_577082 [Zopfochytrium polystomum]|nr:hypothetical protein DFJ73DRAFT_577082 [Zopfochytrium polystomum]
METSRTMNSLFTSASSYVLRNLNSRALDLGLTKFNSQGTLSTLIGGDAGEEDRRERLAHLETIERFFVDHGFTSDLLDHSFLPIVDAFQHCRDAPPKRATGGLSSLVRSFTHSLILHPPSLGVSASPSAANLSAAVTCTTLTVASPRSVEDVGGDDVDDDAGQHQCLAAADAAPQITPIRPSASTDSFHALPGSAFQPVEHGAVGGLRSASTPSVRESATGGIVVGGEGDGGQQPGCDDSAKKLEGSSRQSSPVRLSRPGSTMPRITELDCTEIKKFSWSLDCG